MDKWQIFVALFSATMRHSHFKLGMLLWQGSYRWLTEFTPASFSLFSDLKWSSAKVLSLFLSNRYSQSLITWYGASAWDPTGRLQNSGLQFIYFLFYDFVYFPTEHGLVPNICRTFLRNYGSQPLQIWYGGSASGPTHHLPNLPPPVIYSLFTC